MKKFLSTLCLLLLCGAGLLGLLEQDKTVPRSFDPAEIPAYSGQPWADLDLASLDVEDIAAETFTPLDALGRCGPAEALVGPETMPEAEREGIGMVRPSGWQLSKYDFIDGRYLFNRCHLIGYQLTGQNANELNLITGTRAMNVEGMLPFENRVASYVRSTGHHVRYRVTPVFQGEELVARGVRMEAASVEDDGLRLHVYIYNVQPGVTIDYATGDNWSGEKADAPTGPEEVTYLLNISSMKFHKPDCSGAADMKPANRREFTGTREEAVGRGYAPCGLCKP